ncbi:DMT family transporter [Geoglobus acetivorans]|uniref:Permease of the drug/metabolite transporter (DMT) superfamily n=1 Tax=Geoglobus acetivorans TaxID=565033 RepID=A0A0A7GGP0_GEOAI|nr:Permease of the drug/metabolite transporter (DMT) superfamily [Geoglobus acetivorans]
MNSERKYVLALLGTAVVWAASFIFVKISLGEVGPFNLALYRFLIAAPVLYMILKMSGRIVPVSKQDLPGLVFLALTGVTLLYAVQFLALVYTTATNSSILINTSAIFVSVLSFTVGEKLTGRKFVALILAFAGVVLTASKGNLEFLHAETLKGDLLMIFDGFLWALYTLGGKRLLERYNPETLTVYAFAIGAVLLLPFAYVEGIASPATFSTMTWISIAFLALLCSVFGYVVWYSALSVMEATKVAVFVYLIPLFTAVMAYFALGEDIGLFTVLGGILIVLGVYLVERS